MSFAGIDVLVALLSTGEGLVPFEAVGKEGPRAQPGDWRSLHRFRASAS